MTRENVQTLCGVAARALDLTRPPAIHAGDGTPAGRVDDALLDARRRIDQCIGRVEVGLGNTLDFDVAKLSNLTREFLIHRIATGGAIIAELHDLLSELSHVDPVNPEAGDVS